MPANTALLYANDTFMPQLSPVEIEDLLKKLARGHLSTLQEEYATLKKALSPRLSG